MFIEYDEPTDSTSPKASIFAPRRYNRFFAVFPESEVPKIIVDSGHQASKGAQDSYQTVYSGMVDAELARAPQADIIAGSFRSGDHFDVKVLLTNKAGCTLAWATNGATVHVVVYQQDDTVQSGHLTKRFALAAVYKSIISLADGASALYQLTTPDLSGVDWDHLHLLVLVDYRPGGASGAYDMLQAAVPVPGLELFPVKLYLPLMIR